MENMRKYNKNQCKELICTLEEAHGEVSKYISKNEINTAASILEQCQQAAIAIGDIVESAEGEGTEAVSRLEAYCELTYNIHEDLVSGAKVSPAQTEKKLKKVIRSAQNNINALPTTYEAVFLPYKASMWDSLESIWMAADEDEHCDAYVIPIPYYDKNPDGSFARLHYEADQYPDYVPVINYGKYNLEERHPDMIFIHNPYDNWNLVTSVHPDFYSDKLKGHTDCLVYVPYWATAGMMSEGQAFCPSYMNADHIVVQSKEIIEQFSEHVPREKFLPLGSPKFDRAIRLCKNPPEPPEEWREKMEGKKVFFYNTSIGGMLDNTDSFMKKMKYVFDSFKGSDDACILWRPHPLLVSTLESMRPAFLEEYNRLKKYYTDENIGIYDTTPDIGTSIACSDAYIGDAGTSVISLFGVAGKEIYILNNLFHEAPEDDDWETLVGGSVRGDRNNRYALCMGNKLFFDENRNGHYRYVTELSGKYSGGGYYGSVVENNDKVLLFPVNAENILVFDTSSHDMHTVELKHEVGRGEAFASASNLIFSENPEIFYLFPNRYPSMAVFNAKNEKVRYIKDEAFSDDFSVFTNGRMERKLAPKFFWRDEGLCAAVPETEKMHRFDGCEKCEVKAPDGSLHMMFMVKNPSIPGITLKGPKIVCIDRTGKKLRAIQVDTGKVQEKSIKLNGFYKGLLIDPEKPNEFWFMPHEGTGFCKWNISDDTWEKVDVSVDSLVSFYRPDRFLCNERYFSNGVFHDGKLILAPDWGNKFVELDTTTHEVNEWVPPFSYSTEDKNDYKKNWSVGFFFRDTYDYACYFYYAPEHILYELDLKECKVIREEKFEFDREEVFSLATGFHLESQWLPYCCFEDIFNPIAGIVRGDIHGKPFSKDIQIEAYADINASPEGDCGERVYRTMVESLH